MTAKIGAGREQRGRRRSLARMLLHIGAWLAVPTINGTTAMEKIHIANPEPVVFLELAAELLDNYRDKHGAYARKWPDLDITYANGPCRITDPDIRPPPNSGETWRPRNAEYTYRLTTNRSGSRFQVDALDRDGIVAYYIRSGQTEPVQAKSPVRADSHPR